MTPKHKSDTKVALEVLMREYGFTTESRFYRATLPEFLNPTDQPGVYQICAMADPSEAVTNVYEQGHTTLAQHIGRGLAFSESADHEWLASDRTSVEVRLQDVLDQGGLIYPVESVITDRAWYLTLPDGSISVREVK